MNAYQNKNIFPVARRNYCHNILVHFYKKFQDIIIIFYGFPWLSMILAVFHDFPGLENGLTKFHEFPWLSRKEWSPWY